MTKVINGKREDWADYVKCFAIFLMVMCHFNLNSIETCHFIWIFHMPVFFLISGYFDKGVSLNRTYVKKCFKTLLVPYFFFSVFSLSYCWVSPYLHPECYHNGTMPQTFFKAIVGMFLMDDVVRPYAFMPCLGAWFLAALFEIKVFFSLLCYCRCKCKYIIPILLLIPFGIVAFDIPYFSMDSAALGLVFYFGGYLLKRYDVLKVIANRAVAAVLTVALFVYLWFIGMRNGVINMDGGNWGNSIWMFYVNGFWGSLFCIAIAKIINYHISIISEIGQSTLSILGTHGLIGIVGKTLCVLLFGADPRNFPMVATILMSIGALYVGVLIQCWLSRCLPWAVGKPVKQ